MSIKLSNILSSKVKIGLHNSQESNICYNEARAFDDSIKLYQPSGYSYIEQQIEIPNIDEMNFDNKYISFSVNSKSLAFDVSASTETIDSYFLLIEIKDNPHIISGSLGNVYNLNQVDDVQVNNVEFSIEDIEIRPESKDMIAREML